MKTLNWGKSNLLGDKENEFLKASEELFDVLKKDTECLLRQDRMRTTEAIEEDIVFIRDQKGDRKMEISEENDNLYESAIERKRLRLLKMQQ